MKDCPTGTTGFSIQKESAQSFSHGHIIRDISKLENGFFISNSPKYHNNVHALSW